MHQYDFKSAALYGVIRSPTECMAAWDHTPNGILIGPAIFVVLTLMTNRQMDTKYTDHATCVTVGHVLRCDAA